MVWSFAVPAQPNGSGYTDVWTDGRSTPERITLPGPDRKTTATDAWLDLAADNAEKYGVPLAWVMAVIYAESGGNPRLRNDICCAGLMQLSRKVFGKTDEQLFVPETSVDLGTKELARLQKKWGALPKVASGYNHGDGFGIASNSKSVWGMAEDMPALPWHGYIEKVVRAANWYQGRLDRGELRPHGQGPQPAPPGPPEPPAPEPIASSWFVPFAGGVVLGFVAIRLVTDLAQAQVRGGARGVVRARPRTTG